MKPEQRTKNSGSTKSVKGRDAKYKEKLGTNYKLSNSCVYFKFILARLIY